MFKKITDFRDYIKSDLDGWHMWLQGLLMGLSLALLLRLWREGAIDAFGFTFDGGAND